MKKLILFLAVLLPVFGQVTDLGPVNDKSIPFGRASGGPNIQYTLAQDSLFTYNYSTSTETVKNLTITGTCTGCAGGSGGTVVVASGKTFTVNNTLTLAGTDGTTITFPSTSATIARTDAANTFTGHQTIEGVTSTGATGTGAFVFATSPTLITPVLGAATATTINLVTLTQPATGSTLTLADGKTLTVSNSLTLAGTDSQTFTFPNGSGTVVTLGATQTLTAKTLTAPVISSVSNTGTVTLPTATGGLSELFFCGATSGSQVCANTSGGATARVIAGNATLSSGSAVISSISPAFTSTATFACTTTDVTTAANPSKAVNTSSSSITITDAVGTSDAIAYICVGY